MSYDLERATDAALAALLTSATDDRLRALHDAAVREHEVLRAALFEDVIAIPPRLRLARLLRDRAEVELGAREAIRAGVSE